jgi:hypothetical protein
MGAVTYFASAASGAPMRRVALLSSVFPATIGIAVTLDPNGGPGRVAGIAFATFALLLTWWSLGGVAILHSQLDELRVPRSAGPLAGICIATVLTAAGVPALFVYAAHGDIAEAAIIGTGAVAGVACAFLEPWLTRQYSEARRARARPTAAWHWTGSTNAANRSSVLAYRMALGRPYAPTSWSGRLADIGILTGVAGLAPTFEAIFGGWRFPSEFVQVLHASWGFSLWSVAVVCWVWPMTQSLKALGFRSGTTCELALLPMGVDHAARRHALYCAIVAGPLACVALLAAVAAFGAFLDHSATSLYPRLLLGVVLLTGTTLLPVLQGIAGRATAASSSTVFLTLAPVIAWSPGLFLSDFSGRPLLRWVLAFLCAAGLASWIAIAFSVRSIARKPHPFAEVSRTTQQLPLELRNQE